MGLLDDESELESEFESESLSLDESESKGDPDSGMLNIGESKSAEHGLSPAVPSVSAIGIFATQHTPTVCYALKRLNARLKQHSSNAGLKCESRRKTTLRFMFSDSGQF